VVKVVGAQDGRNLIERTSAGHGYYGTFGRSFTIELPVAVRPNRYCLSFPATDTCHRPANWTLSASLDGKAWTTLCTHVEDQALISATRASWPVLKRDQAFKHFQLTSTDHGGDSEPCFHVCGFELYGQVRLE
jgi:hypothetical protein